MVWAWGYDRTLLCQSACSATTAHGAGMGSTERCCRSVCGAGQDQPQAWLWGSSSVPLPTPSGSPERGFSLLCKYVYKELLNKALKERLGVLPVISPACSPINAPPCCTAIIPAAAILNAICTLPPTPLPHVAGSDAKRMTGSGGGGVKAAWWRAARTGPGP